MLHLSYGLIALLAASPSLAAFLQDGQYKISYSPAPCGIETKHYLDLSGPTKEATFNPIPESEAQVWQVTGLASNPLTKRLRSTKYPNSTLGYPTAKDGTRLRGDDGTFEDIDVFRFQDTGKDGYYYAYTTTSDDFVVNGDTRIEPRNRFAYFRGNITKDRDQFPLPMLPLLFTRVVLPNPPVTTP